MHIREYSDADFKRIQLMHEQSGASFGLPAINDTEFFSRRIVEQDGIPVMGMFLQHTAEAYFTCDGTWRNEAWRDEAIRKLHIIGNEDAKMFGIKQVVAFVEPGNNLVANKLKNHDWNRYRKGEWRCFWRQIT